MRSQPQPHPLGPFFQQVARNVYEGKLGLKDPDLTSYVAQLLCEFSEAANLYTIHGRPIDNLNEMIEASDPVYGTAPSFDAERAVRKHIGDYTLFVAGMYPEFAASSRRTHHYKPSLKELIETGKESYFIVSQFNLFEYEKEAPLFARLSDNFERYIFGLTIVRETLAPRKPMLPPPQAN